tara:strand:+ start:13 stop:540 length:528 start_codon:yes stop_codon:yes gene_type:complete
MKWYKGEIDDAITEGVRSRVVTSSQNRRSNNNNNSNNNNKIENNDKAELDYSNNEEKFIKDTKVEELTESDFNDVERTNDIVNILQKTIDNKNNLIANATNPLLKPQDGVKIDSGITIERGTLNIVKIFRNGKLVKKFDFNPGNAGFDKTKDLPALIEEFNNVMTTKFQNKTFAD